MSTARGARANEQGAAVKPLIKLKKDLSLRSRLQNNQWSIVSGQWSLLKQELNILLAQVFHKAFFLGYQLLA